MSRLEVIVYRLKRAILKPFSSSFSRRAFAGRLLTALLVVSFLLTSGYSSFEFSFSNKVVALIYVVLFLASLALFFYYCPKLKKGALNTRRLLSFRNAFAVLVFISLCVAIMVTLRNNNNMPGAMRYLITLFSCLLIASSISFPTFAKTFVLSVFGICVLCIPVFLIAKVAGASSANGFYLTNNAAIIYAFKPFEFLVNKWYSSNSGVWETNRLAGPFWEPSIFAAVIVIAMFLLSFSDIKRKWIVFAVLLISLVMTLSTGGFVSAVIVILFFVARRIKSTTRQAVFVFSSLTLFIVGTALALGPLLPYLVSAFPSIFGKLISNGEIVRFISFPRLFTVFTKSPVFGFGINGAKLEYISLFPADATDFSITSTSGMLLAAFGLPGLILAIAFIVLPLFIKRLPFCLRCLTSLLFLLLINLENMMLVSAVTLTLVFLAKEGLFGQSCLETRFAESPRFIDFLFNDASEGKTAKGMLGLLVVKGLSMICGLLAVPVYNSFFGTNELFGAWSVVISVLTWTLLLDFGFGSGLRARLPDAGDDVAKRKSLISSAYIGSLAIGIIALLIFGALICVLDLNALMGIPITLVSVADLKVAMFILLGGLCAELVLKNISFIHYAEKRPVRGALFPLITNLSVIILLAVFQKAPISNRLVFASSIYALATIVPLVLGTAFYFFSKKGRPVFPSVHSFNMKTCRAVMSFGLLFFFVQLGFLLICRTDSLFISNLYGPEPAGDYAKYYRIFSFFIGLMGSVVQQPMWSAVAAGMAAREKKKVLKCTYITVGIAFALFLCCLACGAVLQPLFDVWLGSNTIPIDSVAVVGFLVFSGVLLISDAFIIVANGMKIIKIQAIITALSGTIKIAVVILAHYVDALASLGWPYLLLLDAACYLPLLIALPICIWRRLGRLDKTKEVSL